MNIRSALLVIFTTAVALPALAAGPFDGFGGRWSGAGVLVMTNGQSEKMKCIATYFPSPNGAELNMNARCATSKGLKIDAKSALSALGRKISGTFEEHDHDISGSVSGAIANGTIRGVIAGRDWNANITVIDFGAQVVLVPMGGAVRIVSMSFHKG